jgi:transcription antitermination factor NusG
MQTPGSFPESRPGDLDANQRWFVVQTQARCEIRADAQLRAQRFRTFYPRVERTVRHARKMRTTLTAAFPGYLFVQLDLSRERWRSINGTVGVSRLIMGGDLPLPVRHGVVETLMGYVDETGVARFERDLREGQTVRVKAGPLTEAIGKLVRLDGNGRVRVLLEIMGVQASLERSVLEAA